MATKKASLYWDPKEDLHMGYMLRHQAPQLVGRLRRSNTLQAVARMAAKKAKPPKLPKMPSLAGAKAALAVPKLGMLPAGSQPPAAPVPRLGGALSVQPP